MAQSRLAPGFALYLMVIRCTGIFGFAAPFSSTVAEAMEKVNAESCWNHGAPDASGLATMPGTLEPDEQDPDLPNEASKSLFFNKSTGAAEDMGALVATGSSKRKS